ncbi:MAG: TonB-dependent receptor [Pseudomonadota bacterium]
MKLNRARADDGVVSKTLLCGVSTLGLLAATPALAQEAEGQPAEQPAEDEGELIIVTGIRASLESAQELKRESDTVVDVVTASDIGALPDRSVSEVLQRVPGVNVLRFSGADDPDHFAVEGSGVNVRGIPFVRSELNGRDVFGANSSGILGFEDVSPELLGSVVVFKNQTADLIEGGLSGTIDLRTRLPFDKNGQVVAFSIEGNYGDFAEQVTPTVSGLYSNAWDTDGGRFGILLNAAYSNLKSRADAVSIADFREADYGFGTVYVPGGGGVRTQQFDRERLTLAGALQYESPDGRWLATAQFLRSDSDLVWGENVTETTVDNSGSRDNLDPSDFVFDEDGVFQSGTISDNSQWRGPNPSLFPSTGGQQLALFRERSENDVTNDFGFNLKFAPTDDLRFNFDVQYIDSEAQVTDLTVHGSFFAPIFIDISEETPIVTHVIPDGEPDRYYRDFSNFFLRSTMDHLTDNEADSLAFRGDVEYDFSGDGWLRSVRAGARYSQQDRLLRQSDFNWGNMSEVWSGNELVQLGGNSNPDIEAAVSGNFALFPFTNFNRDGEGTTGLSAGAPFYSGPATEDYEAWAATIEAIRAAAGGASGSGPFGGPYATLANRVGSDESLIAGTPFFPSEVGNVNRDDIAAYIRVDWGQDFDSGTSLTGNIGLRYVRSKREVDTVTRVPSFASLFNFANPDDPDNDLCNPANPSRLSPTFVEPGVCSEDRAALQALFGDGRLTTEVVETDYDFFLPSFNAKLEFDGGHIFRFAASRTMARPGVDDIFQRVRIDTLPDVVTSDGMGGDIATFGGFTAAGVGGSPTGNASLLPQTAWNFDLTYEYYFSRTGSITLTGFYKSIDDYINFEPVVLEADGFAVPRNAAVNASEKAEVKGFEFAYQQFYDFLPGFLSGLGMQFNYSYIDAEGVEPSLDLGLPAEDDIPVAQFAVDRGIFPRVSKHNLNAVGLYEKGGVQARVAYNWRSSFQLTPRDVIFPFASIYQPATGQLDASIFFDVTDNVKVGLQGVNLLDDVTETTQSINEDGLRAPRNYFRNDRRYTLILRADF